VGKSANLSETGNQDKTPAGEIRQGQTHHREMNLKKNKRYQKQAMTQKSSGGSLRPKGKGHQINITSNTSKNPTARGRANSLASTKKKTEKQASRKAATRKKQKPAGTGPRELKKCREKQVKPTVRTGRNQGYQKTLGRRTGRPNLPQENQKTQITTKPTNNPGKAPL